MGMNGQRSMGFFVVFVVVDINGIIFMNVHAQVLEDRC